MTIETTEAAILVLCAEDMYVRGSVTPKPDERIGDAGWTVVAHIISRDVILPEFTAAQIEAGAVKKMSLDGPVFYGFLAQRDTDPTEYVAAVRGTDGFAEWAINAKFPLVPYQGVPPVPNAKVEDGFYSIYRNMKIIDLASRTESDVAAGIAEKIGDKARVTVAGHSLGAALATYLSLEVAERVGDRASAVMFASPRPGNTEFAEYYNRKVTGGYRLFNYILDTVTHIPFVIPPDLDYEPLPQQTTITPFSSSADVKVDLYCNHHLVCYMAMLNYDFAEKWMTEHGIQEDKNLFSPCVLGPRRASLNAALAETLALLLEHLDEESLVKTLAERLGWKPGS